MPRRLLACTQACVLSLAAVVAGGQSVPSSFDVIVRGGTIVDGSGSPRFRADLAIAGEHIVAIGDLAGASARTTVDASGQFVTPGFINIHSHATPEGLRTAANMLTQGVTLEVLNADGAGPTDLAVQRALLEQGGLAVNVGLNIGFNAIWTAVVGAADRRASPEEIARMRALLVRGLEQGAWGVSAGLDYKPAYFATTAEVMQVVGAAAPWRTVFPNHDRVTPESNYSSRAGIQETIAIGAEAGLVPVVTHMKAQGREQGTAPALLEAMDAATRRGHYTAADVYPYLAGQSGLGALIVPAWAQDGGREAMLKRFADPGLRARIVKEAEDAMAARFGGPRGVFATTDGVELVDAMERMQVGAGEALLRLLEKSESGAILRFGIESDLVAILKHPTASVSCDCGATSGPIAHPRYHGTFPRVLGRYTREQQHLTWEDAVRKMTGLPAATIGAVDRGLLAVGMAADVTVFDPRTILDFATFAEPTRPSVGVRQVLVNGRFALRDGEPTGLQAGRLLARSRHMPSRPMSAGMRRDAFDGTIVTDDGARVQLSYVLEQPADAVRARGRLRLQDSRAGLDVELTEAGVLQQSRPWTSFTGLVKPRDGHDVRPLLVIRDEELPGDDRGPYIVIDLGARYRAAGRLQAR